MRSSVRIRSTKVSLVYSIAMEGERWRAERREAVTCGGGAQVRSKTTRYFIGLLRRGRKQADTLLVFDGRTGYRSL